VPTAAELTISDSDRRWLQRQVTRWFQESGRRFAWRESDDPYAVLIAELLLQRTRADLVPTAYDQFIATYPTPTLLARATPDDVAALLRRLGYEHRSRRLPLLGRMLVEHHGGQVPRSEDELLALPGVGRYIANAVRAVAFRERVPLFDPNVARVLDRVFEIKSSRQRARDDDVLWQLLNDVSPRRHSHRFALGLIDIGAVICRPRRPRCHSCPLRARCRAFRGGLVQPATTPLPEDVRA
jgi:A/G-specific adenine glycosylase